MFKRVAGVLFVVAVVVLLAVPAKATVIDVTNGDFEAQYCGDEYDVSPITDWYDNNDGSKVSIYNDSFGFPGRGNVCEFDSPDGSGYIYQQIGTYTAGETVSISGLACARAMPENFVGLGYKWTYNSLNVQLWSGGNGSAADGTVLGSGGVDATLVATHTITPAALGWPATGIAFLQTAFNVHLTESGGSSGAPCGCK